MILELKDLLPKQFSIYYNEAHLAPGQNIPRGATISIKPFEETDRFKIIAKFKICENKDNMFVNYKTPIVQQLDKVA